MGFQRKRSIEGVLTPQHAGLFATKPVFWFSPSWDSCGVELSASIACPVHEDSAADEIETFWRTRNFQISVRTRRLSICQKLTRSPTTKKCVMMMAVQTVSRVSRHSDSSTKHTAFYLMSFSSRHELGILIAIQRGEGRRDTFTSWAAA
jgi:hypothetical protein